MKRDWVDWTLFVSQVISAFGAAGAIWFAALTIKGSKVQAKKSNDALIRERRVDFELRVLRDLAEYNLRSDHVSGAHEQFTVLAAMLPAELVPQARAAVRVDTAPRGREAVDASMANPSLSGTARNRLKLDIQQEILAAIALRVSERGDDN